MRKIIATFLAVAFFLVPMAASAASDQDEERIKGMMLEGQDQLFARDYAGALKTFKEVERQYPDSPAGWFGEMAVYEIRMLEREDFHLQKKFLSAAKVGLEKVSHIGQKYNPSKWDIFISGALLGLDAFFKARKGNWWDAYTEGGESRQLFKRVKKMDPNYYDADFGLGMYLYWRSVFAKDLWFLKMFPDRRAEGIAIVKNVAENGRFSKELARVNLAVCYFEEKRYKEALPILEQYVKRYPNNVILRKLFGKVLVTTKQYDRAIEQFRAMLEVDSTFKKPHYFLGAIYVLKKDPKFYPEAEKELRTFLKTAKGKYWPASAHYWLGRLEEQRGNKAAAKREYKTALKLDPKIKAALKRVRGLGGGL